MVQFGRLISLVHVNESDDNGELREGGGGGKKNGLDKRGTIK